MLDVSVEIAEDAELDNIRPAKKGEAKFKVTMRMGEGSVKVLGQEIKSSLSSTAGRALQERSDDHAHERAGR
jgi:hypothetical protein